MSWKDKAISLYKRYGTPAKFAAKMVLGTVLPGGAVVVDLVGQLLDCVHEMAKDQFDIAVSRLPAATAEDLKRAEAVLDVLNGELSGLTAQVAALENLPDAAAHLLEIALATDDRSRQAVLRLDELGRGFDRLAEQNGKLLESQGYAGGLLEEMLPLMRRLSGVAAYIEEMHAAGLSLDEFRAHLHAYQKGARAFAEGRVEEAQAVLVGAAQAHPQSAAAAVAAAAAQVAGQDLPAAEKTLARAARLCPRDPELADLHRQVTQASRGPTPVNEGGRRAPAARLKVGAVLDGWRLVQLLGHGGWGQVFKASRSGQVRALKVMHPDLSRDPAFVERFKGEILTLAGLRGHKNVVEIHGFGYAADAACWYFVMEYIEGVSLEQYLKRKGPLSQVQAQALFGRLADGLALAHGRGVVHRDIKPANILLRKPQGAPVLVDFGLAALALGCGQTLPGHSAGYTPMFAAPEQLRGKPADARSDIYSLAATLYYAVTYDKPEHREPDEFEPEQAPKPLRDLLNRAIQQKPERRPQNAVAFREALQAIVIQPPTPAITALKVTVPGSFARPSDDPEAEYEWHRWETVAETPGTVQIDPQCVYRFCLSWEVTDDQLAGIAGLSSVANLQELSLAECEQVTDAGLAHLRGLTHLQKLRLNYCTQFTEAGLAHLRGLANLQELSLERCEQVTDAGLAHLRGLTKLRFLDLSCCKQITDAGLAHLRGLANLQDLNLHACTHVTDAGLAHLRGLANLQILSLSDCMQFTDAGLAHLRDLSNLLELDLGECKRITDGGLAHLSGLANLRFLDLNCSKRITDAGLAHLRGLANLQKLDLSSCKGITDAGLAQLRGLANLQKLDLRWCKQVTDAGRTTLRTVLPKCDISG